MPYDVKKEGKKYEVETEGTGKVHGTFSSREKALAQLRALYVHAPPGEEHKAHGGPVGEADFPEPGHEGPHLSDGAGEPNGPTCPCGVCTGTCSMCSGGSVGGYDEGGQVPFPYEEPGNVSPRSWDEDDEEDEDGEDDGMYARALRSRYRR